MKEIRELDKSKLTTEQKLGLLLCANLNHGDKDVDDAVELIKNHSLGAVWVTHHHKQRDEIIAKVKEAADYPIIIMCDAENGCAPHNIPGPISLTAAHESEVYAYSFGRATAALCAKTGYNTVCNPLLDRRKVNSPCGGMTRTMGPDKQVVSRLGAAIARGLHDGGVLTIAKHYPSSQKTLPYDTHMREGFDMDTREELIEDALYPYRKMIEEDLIDGVMVGHNLLPNIDPDRPASLSRPVLDVLRDCGFKGFYISDALNMMGVVLKYGNYVTTPMAVEAGCDMPLSWGIPCLEAVEALKKGYSDGMITDEQLEISLDRVLAAHHRIMLLPKEQPLYDEDVANIERINRECISAVCAEGYTPAINTEGKHLFVIMTDGDASLDKVEYDAFFSNSFYNPKAIADKIKSLFPNSFVVTHPEYPNLHQNMRLFKTQESYEDIVWITSYATQCFIGKECLTRRTVDLMDALQSTDRIVAHLHFGNPFVATDAPFIPRVLLGWNSAQCINNTLDILAGKAEALGTQPYAEYLTFHKKGDIIL